MPDPAEKQGDDPLTPTDQKFATLKDLAANYRLFVNRVEQQLYSIGGGGAGFIKDLDDVNIDGLERWQYFNYGMQQLVNGMLRSRRYWSWWNLGI